MSTPPKPGRRLPEWVKHLRIRRHRTNVALAFDVADAVLALRTAQVPAPVTRRLEAIIQRADQTSQGVPVSVAARVLDVTEPAARAWIDRGALQVVPGSRPLAVSSRSLGEALAAVVQVRQVGDDERLLRRILDAIEDQRMRADVTARIDELDTRVPIDPDRIAEELFS